MTQKNHRAARIALAITSISLGLVLTTGSMPAVGESTSTADSFSSQLTPATATTVQITDEHTAELTTVSTHRTSTPIIRASSSSSHTTVTSKSATASKQTATRTASKTTASATASKSSELKQAQSILASYIAKYPILKGSTVTIGNAKGYQAICYYRSGRIVISPTHTSSLTRIIRHEIGHIIDWRDNGVIDWGEKIPAL